MRRICVVARQAGSVLGVLGRELPLLPGAALHRALKQRDIRLNGLRVSSNVQVRPGDELVVFTSVPMQEVPVVYEDADCLVVNKPAGLNTDDNASSHASLISWARARAQEGTAPCLVHRLDNRTCGLVILAQNPQAQDALAEVFRHGGVDREYTALVLGRPQPSASILTAWLVKDAAAARVKIYDRERPGSRRIATEYETLAPGEVSRLRITLHTGRTHQIRAHMAFAGTPVLGDDAYGDRTANRAQCARGLKLCASALGFRDDCPLIGLRGRRFEIDAPF